MPIQRKGMRALQIWCQRVTKEYDNVNITDLTTSFRDGLAFCAIIHHFRPDLMPEFFSLKSEDIFNNNDLAYKTAEDKLDIPNLLDPQDMVDCQDPDKFSVVTYVSQFYHLFKDADGSRNSPDVSLLNISTSLNNSRNSESENDSLLHSSSAESTPLGTPTPSRTRMFNQADLIAKYGEEIFSTSEKKSFSSSSSSSSRMVSSSGKIGMNTICSDMLAKAKISEEKKCLN